MTNFKIIEAKRKKIKRTMFSKAKFTEKIRILSEVEVGAIGGGNSTLLSENSTDSF